MKAIIYTRYGSPEVLHLAEVDKPIVKSNQILIKNKATTVNSADVRIRKADPFLVRLAFGLFRPKKKVLGLVFSGIVEAVGQDVTEFKPGDEVFGLNDSTLGCNAEYLVVPAASSVALKPKNMSFEEAASLVFGGHTALHFLKKAEVGPGKKVLIYGASGAVGTSAVQLAKHFGAEVTAITSTGNLDLMRSLGADTVIDYAQTNLQELINSDQKFDVVYETVNKTEVNQIAQLVKPGGVIILGAVIIKGAIQGLQAARKYKIQMIAGVASVTAQDMDYLRQLAEMGNLKPVIDQTYPLTELVEAHRYVDQGHKKGNVVISIYS
jgi:NADPH:quinone reductase-like Zn-dependent oxidoreductase